MHMHGKTDRAEIQPLTSLLNVLIPHIPPIIGDVAAYVHSAPFETKAHHSDYEGWIGRRTPRRLRVMIFHLISMQMA